MTLACLIYGHKWEELSRAEKTVEEGKPPILVGVLYVCRRCHEKEKVSIP